MIWHSTGAEEVLRELDVDSKKVFPTESRKCGLRNTEKM